MCTVYSFVVWRWPGPQWAAIPPQPAYGLTSQVSEYHAQSTCDNVVLTIRLAPPTSHQMMCVFANRF